MANQVSQQTQDNTRPWTSDGQDAPRHQIHGFYEKMVGAAGFEPTTPSPPVKCATRLRYAPTSALYARSGASAILFYVCQPD